MWLFFLTAWAWGPGDESAPDLLLREHLYLMLPPGLLERAEVKEQLHSGLTTTFRIGYTPKPAPAGFDSGAFRIDIRFEPWEEQYFVRAWQVHGQPFQAMFSSYESLISWWREPYLILQFEPPKPTPVAVVWNIVMEVIPFSHMEQDKAREWLALGDRSPSSGRFKNRVTPPGKNETKNATNVMSIILATSIQRDVLFRYSWKVAHQP